jgi:hypothetical protein
VRHRLGFVANEGRKVKYKTLRPKLLRAATEFQFRIRSQILCQHCDRINAVTTVRFFSAQKSYFATEMATPCDQYFATGGILSLNQSQNN